MGWAKRATKEDVLAASKVLAAAVVEFEKRFSVVETYAGGPRPAYAPTDELYIEHTFGPSEDLDGVIFSWKTTVEQKAAAAPEGSALYWRVRPEIDYINDFGQRGWGIYCRFIISNKPRKD